MKLKSALLSSFLLGVTTISSPCRAQFSSFSTSSDSCSSFCVKLDLGSSNSDSSFSNSFSSSSSTSTGGNNLRWQVGITWRPNPPEILQGEAERVKQKLEDNRSLMMTLTEAIAQNKTELVRGIAILLAPRLGYSDPRKLIAELKEGSVKKEGITNPNPNPIEIPKGTTNPNPNLIELPKVNSNPNPTANPNSIEIPKINPNLNPNPIPIELPKGTNKYPPISKPIELR